MKTRPRSDEGATLAFIAAAAVIVIIVGIGFFVLSRMLGGGREAQSATDSGNLNVAKQALITPAVDVTSLPTYPTGANSSRLQSEFGGLITGNQVNLENYNRLVGKALLIALNAKEEDNMGATNGADTNATTFASWIQGPNSVGQTLATALATAGNASTTFSDVANANSVRMLHKDSVNVNSTEYNVSWMRQNANVASNVFINSASVGVSLPAGSVKSENGQSYIVGYRPISVAGVNLQAVPLRPGQQPHLVALADFKAEASAPVSGTTGNPGIPPNAFESGSKVQEAFRGDANRQVDTRSSAIVGSPDLTVGKGTFQASIPHGVIVVYDNYGQSQSASGINASAGAAAGVLMEPSFVMATVDHGTPYIVTSATAAPAGDYSNVTPTPPREWTQHQVTSGNPPTTSWVPGPTYTPNFSACDNMNSGPAGTPGAIADCHDAIGAIESYYGSAGSSNPGSYSGLMSIEALKAQIVAIRGSASGSIGCGSATGGACSPLKVYNSLGTVGGSGFPVSSGPFTIGNLLNQANWTSNGTIKTQIEERMIQMNPSQTPAQVDAALANMPSTIYFGGGPYYIYWDSSANSYVFSATAPSSGGVNWLASTSPDGPQTPVEASISRAANSGVHSGDGAGDTLVDVAGDGGYPHPFDCPPPLQVHSNDKVLWQPSSGYGNLMGVINFGNCATGGGQWCCPC